MKFEVLQDLKLKTEKDVIELHKGQTIEVQPAKVTKLVKAGKLQPLPYLDNGILRIPFNSPQKYWWWNRGQSVLDTLKEIKADNEIVQRYKYYRN
ncbi:MAG TPA: hypothetical protein ACFYEK_15230 [Candidatus Wunengus sp. YC60]|uniref:hypothetical protein n=1 Tax=Candidatus Wunengus sp. YC60 TaxID=3367697 RepID=UPI0040271985